MHDHCGTAIICNSLYKVQIPVNGERVLGCLLTYIVNMQLKRLGIWRQCRSLVSLDKVNCLATSSGHVISKHVIRAPRKDDRVESLHERSCIQTIIMEAFSLLPIQERPTLCAKIHTLYTVMIVSWYRLVLIVVNSQL